MKQPAFSNRWGLCSGRFSSPCGSSPLICAEDEARFGNGRSAAAEPRSVPASKVGDKVADVFMAGRSPARSRTSRFLLCPCPQTATGPVVMLFISPRSHSRVETAS